MSDDQMPFVSKEMKEREAEFVRAYNARAQNGHASPVHCAMCIHPMNQKFLSPDFMSSSIKKEGSVHISPPPFHFSLCLCFKKKSPLFSCQYLRIIMHPHAYPYKAIYVFDQHLMGWEPFSPAFPP